MARTWAKYSQYNTEGWDIANKVIFVISNCINYNKVKNNNSQITTREDRWKLMKISNKLQTFSKCTGIVLMSCSPTFVR